FESPIRPFQQAKERAMNRFWRQLLLLSTSFALSAMPCRAAGEDPDDLSCPQHRQQRSAAQVMQDHLTAFLSGSADLVACDYARDAVFLQPGGAAQGRQQIRDAFAGFFAAAGGNLQVATRSLTFFGDAALFEYAISSTHLLVGDGVDTFVIRHGMIELQALRLG